MKLRVTSDRWQVARGEARPVGRDSVEPHLPTEEARARRASWPSSGATEMLTALASLRSRWGSTESHPTGLGRALPRTTRRLSTFNFQPSTSSAFTLLEVMIAMGIFFMCIFVILELVSTNLRHVQRLQKPTVDIGSLAAELSLTNRLEEGGDSGNFGSLYPGVSWSREIKIVGTNGLFQVDFTVQDSSGGGRLPVQSALSIFLYRPDSKRGITLN